MKFIVNRVAVGFLLVTLLGATAFAKTRQANVTFSDDTSVNGTLVKKGTYRVSFNEDTGELSIFKGNKVVARSAARLEMRDRKAGDTEFLTRKVDMGCELVGITFSGSSQNVVVNQAGMQAGGN